MATFWGHPQKLSILLPQDEKAISGGLGDEDEGWAEWLVERERLFRQEGESHSTFLLPALVSL